MRWEHRFIIKKNQDVVLAEVYDLTDIGEGLAHAVPFLEDVTPTRLVYAWSKGPLLEQEDGTLVERPKDDEEDE